jgi:hypothetical protein
LVDITIQITTIIAAQVMKIHTIDGDNDESGDEVKLE